MDKTTQSDLKFLKEMKGHFENADRDVSRKEMLECMINDWIDELEKEVSSPPQQAVSDEEIMDFAWELFTGSFSDAVGRKEKVERFVEGAKWMRDRTPPSEAETILRELACWGDVNDDWSVNYDLATIISAARKWRADNPVKG